MEGNNLNKEDNVKLTNGTENDDNRIVIGGNLAPLDAMSKTTTISTIAVQSGKTRLVIALLNVRNVCLISLQNHYYLYVCKYAN